MKRFFPSLLLLCLLAARPATAWTDPGHMLMARLAYAQLKPEVRKKYLEILKAHPRYKEDLLAGMPEGYADPDLYAWMKAATWPDLIREKTHPLNASHHKPNWHYINFPFVADPADRELLKPREPGDEGGEVDNILKALKLNEARLRDEQLPAKERAVALCWMLHLVADIHQPLHATTLFSKRFPEGDRGGNDFLVKTGAEVQRLHIYWDLLVGYDVTPESLAALYARPGDQTSLRDTFAEELKSTTHRQWANESHELGASVAYQGGKLEGAIRKEYEADPRLPVPALPPGYEEQARTVALRRIAVAACRLADKLNSN